jgi:hypothetical protein
MPHHERMTRCGSVRRPCIVAAVIAVGALFLPGGADGQQPPPQPRSVIVGRVTDTLGTPLPQCFVRLEGARAATLCDSVGRFRLPDLGHEVTTFEVRRIGYRPGRFSVLVLGDSMQVNVQLVPVAIELPPITVTAEGERGLNPSLVEHGFYRRLRFGQTSLFVTPEELERLRPQRVTQVLQDRPGIKITWSQERNGLVPLVQGRNNCPLNVFVDGIEITIYNRLGGRRGGVSLSHAAGAQPPPSEAAPGGGEDLDLDAFILTHTIAAIEIYPSGPNTPIEFRTFNECGAIVIWTKVGPRSAPGDSARIQLSPADTAHGSSARTRS